MPRYLIPFLLILAACDDGVNPDDSGEPTGTDSADDSGEPVDTDEPDDSGYDCPDLPTEDPTLADELVGEAWLGEWGHGEAWFRWYGDDTFRGNLMIPADSAREDYDGTWAWTDDAQTSLILHFEVNYPDPDGPLSRDVELAPTLGRDTDRWGCPAWTITFPWTSNDDLEGTMDLVQTDWSAHGGE